MRSHALFLGEIMCVDSSNDLDDCLCDHLFLFDDVVYFNFIVGVALLFEVQDVKNIKDCELGLVNVLFISVA